MGVSFHQGTLHGEWKTQLVDQRGGGLDLALAPGADIGLLYGALSLPVLISRRLGESVEVVVSTGLQVNRALVADNYVAPAKGMVRGGLAFRFWLSRDLALQPEGTWLEGISADKPRVLNLGLGVSFMHNPQ